MQLLHFNGDQPVKLVLRALRLVNGRTGSSGGAFSANGAKLDVEIAGCFFSGNAAGEGGAVRVGYAGAAKAWIHDSVFVDNDGSVATTGDYLSEDG